MAIVLSHPNQYYSPWFRWLRLNTTLEFRVFYLWEFGVKPTRDPHFETTFSWDVDLLSGYDHEFVPNVASDPGTHHFAGLRNPTLGQRLRAWRPDAVLLFGYAYATHLGVILWGRLRRVPLVFRGDSHFLGNRRPSVRARIALGTLYSQFSAVTYVGAANRDYFRALGVPDRKLHFAPHAVDGTLFDRDNPIAQAAAKALRESLRIGPQTRVVCFAGKFQRSKQPRELLSAYLDACGSSDSALVFVGDGEERPALVELARRAPPGRVHFLPFANQSEMPARYLLTDVFVLPSGGLYETWGLAVNEAMHMGVPCLVSDRVGCQRDLVIDGETGWVFAADNHEQLRAKLREALSVDLRPFRLAAAARVARYSYAAAAQGVIAALRGASAQT